MSGRALEEIRQDLADEARARTLRSLLLLVVLLALAAGFGAGMGLKEKLGPQDLFAAAAAAGFVVLGVSTAGANQRRFSTTAAIGLAVVACISPLLASTTVGDSAGVQMVGCGISIVVLGIVGLLAIRVILGPVRRRFGGAPQLQAAAAALAAGLGVGLHCPDGSATHLMTHVAAAALVGLLVRRWML